MPALVRADAPDLALRFQFFDLFLDRTIRDTHTQSKVRDGN
jgi:hypothetical protein